MTNSFNLIYGHQTSGLPENQVQQCSLHLIKLKRAHFHIKRLMDTKL